MRAADKPFAQEVPVADKPFAQNDPVAAPQSPDRRLFLQRALAVGIGGVSLLTTGFAARSAVGGTNVRRVAIAIPGLPPEAVGMRIALVSDLHLGSVMGRDFCRSVVDLVNAEQPDAVLLVGDLTDGTVVELGDDLRPLSELRSVEGTFFVTGNHEFYFDPDGWLAFIPQLGITVLEKKASRSAACCWPVCRTSRADRAVAVPTWTPHCRPALPGQPVIMMSHQPNLVYDAIDRDVQLMVSGHTHGGQFYPAAFVTAVANPALTGLH